MTYIGVLEFFGKLLHRLHLICAVKLNVSKSMIKSVLN